MLSISTEHTVIQRTTLFLSLTLITLGSILCFLGQLPYAVLIASGLLFICCYFYTITKGGLHYLLWGSVIILSVGIGLYRPESFQYPLLFSVDSLHHNGKPFSLDLNWAKAVAGYGLLIWFYTRQKSLSLPKINPIHSTGMVILGVTVTLIAAIYLLNLEYQIKQPQYIWYFLLHNFFITCVVEEVFFRLVIQQKLETIANKQFKMQITIAKLLALSLTTLLFVLVHQLNSLKLIVVYALASLCYGLVFTFSRRLHLSIAMHFLVNAFHFSLLTYPL
ncbi:CPBP family intramembrane glutamic endopeptidase [Teredinibacter sp. KSP-S5-2]|uniref:CPBP family intramembrane glutamic endopeptidase n=1 Tax=Teredinibacter sp. KSP-S5-2 TaxID=3034506 RepID=UPI0029348761|nr:CPBP family intramembrane glutamic endopeptidase [Teredinibacter sp. KSP-S5-2]WNO11034.1 CPBP family intramembrane metalloprotease [Teredinibacter sp. KSP-S5-2]